MKHQHLHLGAIFLVASSSLLAQATQTTATAPSATETIALPAFTVSDKFADPYRATDTMSAARIRTALIDTPAASVFRASFASEI